MNSDIVNRFSSIFSAKIVVVGLGLLTTPVLVRLLGSSQYGDYAFILSILSMTMILTNAGIFDGVRKYIAEDRTQSSWEENIFGFYFKVGFILAAVAALLYFLFSWLGLASQLFTTEFSIYFYLLSLLIICRQAYSITRGGLMGLGLEERSEPLRALQKILFAGIALYLAYVGYGVVGVLLGEVISTFIVAVFAFIALSKRLDLHSILRRSSIRLPHQELISFNFQSIILIFLTSTLYHFDILLLQPLAGSQSTGYYRAALVIAEFLWLVPNVLQTLLLHTSSQIWSEGDEERITTLSSKTTRYNLSFILLLAIGLSVLADDFMPLYYGKEFSKSVTPLLLLLPGVVGFALARPIFAIGQGKGALRGLIIATGAAAIMNICLNLLLIPNYGTTGAAIATSFSYGSMAIFHILTARHIGFNPIADLRSGRILIAAFLSLLAIILLDQIFTSSYGSLLIVPPIGFLIYIYLTLNLGVISEEETNELVNRLPKSVAEKVGYLFKFLR